MFVIEILVGILPSAVASMICGCARTNRNSLNSFEPYDFFVPLEKIMTTIAQIYAESNNAAAIIAAFKDPEIIREAEERVHDEGENLTEWYGMWRFVQHRAGIISRKFDYPYERLVQSINNWFEP
jgi:hypothetical protein